MSKCDFLVALGLLCLSFLVWFFYWKLLLPSYLTFSDAAKFADIARNVSLGHDFGASFGTFVAQRIETKEGLFSTAILPFYPLLLSIGFKLLGIKDYVVILTSGVFYMLSAVALYFLGQKIFGKTVGFLASLAFISDPAMLNYATSGASEPIFIFELILAALFFYQNTRKSLAFGLLTLVVLYWTRPSAIIYIFGFVIFCIILNFRTRKSILKALGFVGITYILIEAFLIKFKLPFFYSPLSNFFFGTINFSPLSPSTTTLRGGTVGFGFAIFPFLSKTFYDLFNFYKFLPQILSPYLAGFYFLD
ncbi:MAG: glycosyltransferase family 39 protein, partial [Candidatus Levybacteria bacterium]|nr:glycosyltransferase family 39 protein [Candidatus Levybacteria bacterium]